MIYGLAHLGFQVDRNSSVDMVKGGAMTDSEIIERLHETNRNRKCKIIYPMVYFSVMDAAKASGMNQEAYCLSVIGISKNCFRTIVTGRYSPSKYAIDSILEVTGLKYEEAFKVYD